MSSDSTAAELKFEPRMSSLGTQNELSGDSKWPPPASPMSSVGHLAPDPWNPRKTTKKTKPEMDATEAQQVDDLSRQDSLRRRGVPLGCVLSKVEALVELRFHRS